MEFSNRHLKDLFFSLFTSVPEGYSVPEMRALRRLRTMIVFGEPTEEIRRGLRQQCHPCDFIIFIVPFDLRKSADEFRKSLKNTERCIILCSEDTATVLSDLDVIVKILRPRHTRFVSSAKYESAYAEYIKKIAAQIEASSGFVSMERTAALIKLKSSLSNLPRIIKSRTGKTSFRDQVQGRLAVVCSAGPSLSSDFEVMKESREKLFVISVGHAANALLSAGIKPDFIVDIDAFARISHSGGPGHYNSILAAIDDTDSMLINRFDKVFFFRGDSLSFNEMSSRAGLVIPSIEISRSVTITAIALAVKLGFKKIALTGSDLAFSESGHTHVGEKFFDVSGSDFLTVRGIGGSTLRTSVDFLKIKEQIESVCAYFSASSHVRIFNSTSRGAEISGVEHIPLAGFIANAVPLQMQDGAVPSVSMRKDTLEMFASAASELAAMKEKYARASMMIRREFRSAAPSQEKIDSIVSDVAGESENMLCNARSCAAPAFANIIDYSEDFRSSMPRTEQPDIAADAELECDRLNIIADLCGEISSLIEDSLRRTETPSVCVNDPFIFPSILKFNISRVVRTNRELASVMSREKPFGGTEKGFIIKTNRQELLTLKRLSPGTDSPVEITRPINNTAPEMSGKIVEFMNENDYSPARHGVIFLEPGNWEDVAAFASAHNYSGFKGAAICAWPELFCEVMRHTAVMQMLPPDFTVIALHDSMKSWRTLFSELLKNWGESGRTPLFYKCPGPWKTAEIQSFFADFIK